VTDAPPARILVVDDDPAITRTYEEILRAKNYEVITAASCATAMAQLDRVNGEVQVLVVDFGLPDGDGGDFVRDAMAKYGPRPTLFISGWTDEFWHLPDGPSGWLMMRKPVRIAQLLAAVNWLVNGGPKPVELDAPQ
jgi:two-component system, OmpR family, KDP operon response regulator KdpE